MPDAETDGAISLSFSDIMAESSLHFSNRKQHTPDLSVIVIFLNPDLGVEVFSQSYCTSSANMKAK